MWILLSCSVLCLGACLPLFLYYKPRHRRLGAGFKALGTVCALIPALIAALKLDPVYWIFVAALGLHTAADYLLEFSFELGAGFFMLGHACYIIGFLKLYPLSIAHLILLVCFLVYLGFLLSRQKKRLGKNLHVFALYGVVLCVMASCGIAGGATSWSSRGIMTMLGAALFFLSDHLLFQRLLYPQGPQRNRLIMITYYLAQLLLGASCLM